MHKLKEKAAIHRSGLEELRTASDAKLRKILRGFAKECFEMGYDQAIQDFEAEVNKEIEELKVEECLQKNSQEISQ